MSIKFTRPVLIVKNISKSSVTLFDKATLRPGWERDLFKMIPELVESEAITALSASKGQIYQYISKGKLKLLKVELFSLDNSGIDLGFIEEDLGLLSERISKCEKRLGNIRVPDVVNKKEDINYIWSHQDLAINGSTVELTSFSNLDIEFDPIKIVDNSAILVDHNDKFVKLKRGVSGWFDRRKIRVVFNKGSEVALNGQINGVFRIYFLIKGSDVSDINSYECPPDHILHERINLLDVLSSGNKKIIGDREFSGSVAINKKLTVNSLSVDNLDVSGALPGMVLGSGDGVEWKSPIFNYTPEEPYVGQVILLGKDLYSYVNNRWECVSERRLYSTSITDNLVFFNGRDKLILDDDYVLERVVVAYDNGYLSVNIDNEKYQFNGSGSLGANLLFNKNSVLRAGIIGDVEDPFIELCLRKVRGV